MVQAEQVLSQDPHNLKAGLGKAESLFNTCRFIFSTVNTPAHLHMFRFEHALLQYSRGQVCMVETPSASGIYKHFVVLFSRDINSSVSHLFLNTTP